MAGDCTTAEIPDALRAVIDPEWHPGMMMQPG